MRGRKEVIKTEKQLAIEKRERELAERFEEDNRIVLNMKMHESCWISGISKDVIRVQSGWLYSDWDAKEDLRCNSVFVPDTREY